jgi:hypothetical protein
MSIRLIRRVLSAWKAWRVRRADPRIAAKLSQIDQARRRHRATRSLYRDLRDLVHANLEKEIRQ